MSATAFLRQRRAVAVEYIRGALGRSPKAVAEIMAEFGLSPGDLANLAGNNDALTIADRIAAAKLGEEELDQLETIGAIEVGDRLDVHSPDVRADQFEDRLQHPAAETVGVGNMHDGPQAAEILLNVGSPEIDAAFAMAREKAGDDADAQQELLMLDRNSAEARQAGAELKIQRVEEAGAAHAEGGAASGLAAHANLPEVLPSTAPAADAVTAEDEQAATDPEGKQEGLAATPVDIEAAASEVEQQDKADERAERLGEAAINAMDRDKLLEYAGRRGLDLGEVKARTPVNNLRKRVIALDKEAASNG